MNFEYTINGVSLKDPLRRWRILADGTDYSPALTMRVVELEVPGRNGSIDAGRQFRDSSVLPIRVMVQGQTTDQAEQYWNVVRSLFTLNDTFTLGRIAGDVTQTTQAKLRSISEPEFRPGGRMIVGVFLVTILDGAFHGEETALEFDPLETFSNFTSVAIAGTLPEEDWRIVIEGPLAAAAIYDDISGTSVTWTGALDAGEFLLMDGVRARVGDSDDWDAADEDVSGGVNVSSAGPLTLTPYVSPANPLVREVSISGAFSGTSAASAMTVYARGAYA